VSRCYEFVKPLIIEDESFNSYQS